MHPKNLLLPVLITSMFASGCNKISAVMDSTSADEAMGAYALFFNKTTEVASKISKEYVRELPEEGAKFDTKHSFPFASGDPTSALAEGNKGLEAAKKAAPAALANIAPLADATAADAKAVVDAFAEVKKYYDAENFKDDAGKKGGEMHTKMLAAIHKYREDVNKLEAALDVVEDQQSREELKKYSDDKGYSFLFRKMLIEGKKSLAAMDKDDAGVAFKAQHAAVASTQATCEEVSKKPDANAAFKSFSMLATSFANTEQKLLRAMDAKNEQDTRQLSEQLVSGYNSMVSVANSLRTLESSGNLK